MKNILLGKRNGLFLLVLLLMLIAPMKLLVSHIELLAPVSDLQGMFFTLVTNSAGSGGFVVTLAVLVGSVLTLKLSRKEHLAKAMQLGLILVIGFAAKTGLKQVTESPRPYTELLSHQLLVPNPDHFYHLSATQQEKVITQVTDNVSHWRTQHWMGETDYSFPSGHTIFVAICVAFFGGLFMEHKRYMLTAGLMIWAVSVAYSRLWLGMHRPIDLIGSILFVMVAYALLPHFDGLASKLSQQLNLVKRCTH
ncbi:phospholipid phosphatase [Vibrio ponticus]|uniref:undecaprenyl-diphosphate phosphatase n=1 Tax=Vibrio ponticus TaxID=265668 RepID=A0ABX3FLX5_9VIBR|nr:phosphatase PAP2 family protein [Vibrio ponticus]OLQ95063.1 phospholipid phosphatase [Vibrio ponticus]